MDGGVVDTVPGADVAAADPDPFSPAEWARDPGVCCRVSGVWPRAAPSNTRAPTTPVVSVELGTCASFAPVPATPAYAPLAGDESGVSSSGPTHDSSSSSVPHTYSPALACRARA